jgi:hypothetical protein
MRQRCYYQKHAHYHLYGGRGITVHESWINDFPAFLAYIGKRPSPTHSLDRWPNKDGNYEPGNVRWATRAEQGRNRRNNVFVTFKGETLCLQDWARRIGFSGNNFARMFRDGMTMADIIAKYNPDLL